jgi:hypothetical protein
MAGSVHLLGGDMRVVCIIACHLRAMSALQAERMYRSSAQTITRYLNTCRRGTRQDSVCRCALPHYGRIPPHFQSNAWLLTVLVRNHTSHSPNVSVGLSDALLEPAGAVRYTGQSVSTDSKRAL